MNGYCKQRRCTERDATIVDFYLYLAAALVVIHQIIQCARTRYRWDTRPPRCGSNDLWWRAVLSRESWLHGSLTCDYLYKLAGQSPEQGQEGCPLYPDIPVLAGPTPDFFLTSHGSLPKEYPSALARHQQVSARSNPAPESS